MKKLFYSIIFLTLLFSNAFAVEDTSPSGQQSTPTTTPTQFSLILTEMQKLNQRIEDLHKINKKIKKDLNNCNILHKKLRGINVIAAFKTKKQKQEIIDYCKKNKYPYKECPMNIKVNVPAISIEVQQL